MYGRTRNLGEGVADFSRDDNADYRAQQIGPPRGSSRGENEIALRSLQQKVNHVPPR